MEEQEKESSLNSLKINDPSGSFLDLEKILLSIHKNAKSDFDNVEILIKNLSKRMETAQDADVTFLATAVSNLYRTKKENLTMLLEIAKILKDLTNDMAQAQQGSNSYFLPEDFLTKFLENVK